MHIYSFKENIKFPAGKYITLCHHPEICNENNFISSKFKGVTLTNLPIIKNKELKVVNTHYFGDYREHYKNEKTNFICVGIKDKSSSHDAEKIMQKTNYYIEDFNHFFDLDFVNK